MSEHTGRIPREKRIKLASIVAERYKMLKGRAPDKMIIFWLSDGPVAEAFESALKDDQLTSAQREMLEATWGIVMKHEAAEGDRLTCVVISFFTDPNEVHVATIPKSGEKHP